MLYKEVKTAQLQDLFWFCMRRAAAEIRSIKMYCNKCGELAENEFSADGADWIHGNRSLKMPDDGFLSQYDRDFVINDPGNCYQLSTVISHAAYLMWDGVDGCEAINDNELLAKLWYTSLYMLNPDSDFSHCRTAVETAAQRLYKSGLLTKEQVKCVSAAFENVGVGKSAAIEMVAAEPELHIYGANNADYYNYHYKIEKISVKKICMPLGKP